MNLSTKILEAINADLPAATAGELKKFIEQAEVDKIKLAAANEAIAKRDIENEILRKEVAKLDGNRNKEMALNAREAEIASKEVAQAHRAEMLALRENHASQRVHDVMEVTRTVFANNKYKYFQNESLTTSQGATTSYNNGGTEYATNKNIIKSGETEG